MSEIKIACIGDSITFGYEIEETQKWTTLLSEELNVEVVNCGINGDTTAGMLSRFDAILDLHKPTHVIITGGTNDLWFGLKDELIISNIQTMINHAEYLGVVGVVGIPTSCFNLIEINFIGEDFVECIRNFQNQLVNYSLEKELAYIDFSIGLDAKHFFEDGLHPNNNGQKIMSEIAKKILRKIL
ncbi:MAG: hypothetical protein KAJ28_07670 [Flavobacteriaceae bacterium]|nr:hypothetical protein [Flavobacteriaceae bacterium]